MRQPEAINPDAPSVPLPGHWCPRTGVFLCLTCADLIDGPRGALVPVRASLDSHLAVEQCGVCRDSLIGGLTNATTH